jgi:predicted TIM-barrel fold metal-dependent hydrolase
MPFGRSVVVSVALIALVAHIGLAQPARKLPARLVDVHLHVWDSLPPGQGFRDSLLAAFRTYHVEYAVASGDLAAVRALAALAPDRVLAGVSYGPGLPLPTTEELRGDFSAGRLAVFGEIDAAWLGEPLSGSHLAPYWALAETIQVPVAVFTGLAPAGTSFRACCTGYRATSARLQDVEEVLVRHPRLRMDLMQAGWPYRERTIALMHSYPELYADVGNLAGNPSIPREEFFDYLHALIRAGLGKRLMFGSGLSAQEWGAKIGPIIEVIQAAPFLSEEQRADIFYRNAERFLASERPGSSGRAP